MNRIGYISIISVLAIFIVWREFYHFKEAKETKRSIEAITEYFENEKKSMFASRDLIAQDVKEMKQLIVSKSEDVEFLKKQYSDMKKINSVIKAELNTALKGLVVPITKVPEIVYRAGKTDTVYYSKANFTDDWIDIGMNIDSNNVTIDSINVRNKIDVVLGWKKPDKSFKFLRKSEPVVQVFSYSPYSRIGHINNLTVEPEKRTFGKVATFLVGFGAGFLITKI